MKIRKFNESADSNIPSAVEFLHNFPGEPNDDTIFLAMEEFAKAHVKAALAEASKKVQLTDFASEFLQEGAYDAIDKESILNAYPLSNIKLS